MPERYVIIIFDGKVLARRRLPDVFKVQGKKVAAARPRKRHNTTSRQRLMKKLGIRKSQLVT